MDLFARAVEIAAHAHAGTVDKAGAPYLLHPLRVMLSVDDAEERIVAVLHDVIEDSEWTLEGLAAEGFSGAIIEALDCLTKRDGEAYDDYIDRVAQDRIATRVKLADLTDNMDVRRLADIDDADCRRLARYPRTWPRLAPR